MQANERKCVEHWENATYRLVLNLFSSCSTACVNCCQNIKVIIRGPSGPCLFNANFFFSENSCDITKNFLFLISLQVYLCTQKYRKCVKKALNGKVCFPIQ